MKAIVLIDFTDKYTKVRHFIDEVIELTPERFAELEKKEIVQEAEIHVITEQDIELNPELAEQGVEVGEEVVLGPILTEEEVKEIQEEEAKEEPKEEEVKEKIEVEEVKEKVEIKKARKPKK